MANPVTLDDLLPPSQQSAPPPPSGTYKTDPGRPGTVTLDQLHDGRPADPSELLRRQLEEGRRKFGDWSRYAGQELFLGAGDELFSALGADLGDYRARSKRYQAENPAGAAATTAIASLPAAAPAMLMRFPQGVNLLGRMAAQAGLGAGYGMAHGFASGEDTMEKRLSQGLQEGFWGAGFGAGLPAVTATAGGARRMAAPLFSGEGPGSRLMEKFGFGPSGREAITQRILRDDFRPLPTSTANPNPLPGTDFKPTTAQLMADSKLRALELQLLGPEERAALEASQRGAINKATEPLLPGPRLTQAEMDLETARSLVQPGYVGDTPALASTRLHQGLADLRDRARAQVSTAFDRIDMPNVNMPTQPLKDNFKAMIDSFSALAGEKDVIPKSLLKAVDDLGPTTSMEEMQRLRSRLLSDARDENLGSFERRVYNRAAGEVLEAMDAGFSQMGPGSDILKRAYQKARDLTRNMKETFDNERVGHLFDPDYAPSSAATELFTGPGSRERIEAMMKMSQDHPRVNRALKDWLAHDLRDTIGSKEGDAATRAMDRWFKKHEDLFQLNPPFADDFMKMADAHRLATDLGRRQSLIEAIQSGEDPAKLIKKYGPDLDRLFPDASERDLVEAIGAASKMMNLRAAPGVRSKAVRDLSSEDNWMRALTDDSYGLVGKLATLGPVGKFAYKGPKEDVLENLRDRLRSGDPKEFLGLKPRDKLGPRLMPPAPLNQPFYDYSHSREK